MREFDASRAWLKKPDEFKRFRVPDEGEPLESAGLKDDDWLIVAERSGERRAFFLNHMAYHHLAQGTLAGEPYLVSF
ncbi:MAG: DUF3179 domain-containing protein [Planctomycetes bacterium]|nr:DUF3179 domain-containing protein [Planctomycetota bacterium]